jgi:hypothetical protein
MEGGDGKGEELSRRSGELGAGSKNIHFSFSLFCYDLTNIILSVKLEQHISHHHV